MEIAPENDAAKAKRQAILDIMRDTTLTAQEKQKRIQALHTAPDHAVAATAKKAPSPPTTTPELGPSSSPSPPPEDAKPPAAGQVAPESAPEVDLTFPAASRGSRRSRARSRPGSTEATVAMSVTPSPAPAVSVNESPEVAAARKRRDEIMKSATSTGRTRARAGGVPGSRRRSTAKIGRSSFADSTSGGDNDDGMGEDKEKEAQKRNSGDTTAVVSAASRPARRGRRRLADVRANKNDDDGDFEDDRKPAAAQLVVAAETSAPSPVEANDGQQIRPGVVAVSAIDKRIANKSSSLGVPTRSGRSAAAVGAATAAASVEAAAEPPADPVAPTSSAATSEVGRVGAFSCTDLDDKITRKTAGEGRRAGSTSFSATTLTNATCSRSDAREGGEDTSVNIGAKSRSMMPSRTGSLESDGDFDPGSRSVSMYSSRRQRRRQIGSGNDARVGFMAAVTPVPETMVPMIEQPVDHEERTETTFSTAQKSKSPRDEPNHICCKECGRPYTPPEDGDECVDINKTSHAIGGSQSRGTLLVTGSTEITSDSNSLGDEAKPNDERDYRQSTISWGSAAALNFDYMDLDSEEGESHEDVPPATSNVDCPVDNITSRRGSLVEIPCTQGVSEVSLAIEDLERAIDEDHAPNGDKHFTEDDGGKDEEYYYFNENEHDHDEYDAALQDSYNPAHQTDPFQHYSDHFFAGDYMGKEPATRARARRESFVDVYSHDKFALSRDDKCNLLIGLLLITVITIGVSVPVTLIKKETKNVPTMSPTLVRDPEYTTMRDKIILETGTPAEVFEDDDSPQTQALQWVAFDDAAALTADSSNLIQRYSLMCLFFGSGGSSTLLGWDEDGAEDECSWLGVECKGDMSNVTSSLVSDASTRTTNFGSASGHVTSLDLKRSRLAGSLVIGSLPHLEILNIGENLLNGTIPSTLYDLSKLQSLIMEKNFFGPYLTEGIGQLTLLETLSLNDNRFESDLPSTLGNLKALKNLYLFSNSFSGRLVEYILQMPKLEVVDVADNLFTGTLIPSIGRLSNLRKSFTFLCL